MDKGKVVPLITKKHGIQVHPDDPIWGLGTMIEDVQKNAVAQLQAMLTEQLDQISATNVLAEAAAKARAEKLITEAGAWAENRIKTAADEAAASLAAETRKGMADAMKQMNRQIWAAWICTATAACAAIGSVAALWL